MQGLLTLRSILLTVILFFGCVAMTAAQGQFKNGIYFTDEGDGPALVLLHAFPTDHRLWEPQRQVLAKHFRVITMDLYGFGKSAGTDGKVVTMDQQAKALKQLLNYLGIRHAIIAGESMGGYVALAFYATNPDMVDGLVLADTQAIADSPEAMQKREAAAVDVIKNGSGGLIGKFIPKALSDNASNVTKKRLFEIADSQDVKGIASALRGMAARFNTSAVLKGSQLPVLIITGEKDTLISPEQSVKMHSLAKNSRLVVIPGTGHLASLENPDKWNQAVVSMFAR